MASVFALLSRRLRVRARRRRNRGTRSEREPRSRRAYASHCVAGFGTVVYHLPAGNVERMDGAVFRRYAAAAASWPFGQTGSSGSLPGGIVAGAGLVLRVRPEARLEIQAGREMGCGCPA